MEEIVSLRLEVARLNRVVEALMNKNSAPYGGYPDLMRNAVERLKIDNCLHEEWLEGRVEGTVFCTKCGVTK
jgi:hypothetical protein